MTICSLVVQAIPKHLNTVSTSLDEIEGVEVHAQDEHGKLVISIDHPSRRYCSKVMTEITHLKGVMSTSLVFEYQEDLEDLKDLESSEDTAEATDHLEPQKTVSTAALNGDIE